MRFKTPRVALFAGALLALAACTGSSTHAPAETPSSNTESSNSPTIVLGMDVRPQPPAAVIPGAKKGGTLTVLDAGGIYYPFDPTLAYTVDTSSILSGLLVRSLTQFVYDPKTEQMVLIPDLATNLGRPSPDFTTWKFTLRPGVKFENGQPVTAADIKYGIERSFDRKAFKGGPKYSNQFFLHGHTYHGPYRSPGPYTGVTVDGNVITIRMSKPFPDMPYWGAWAAMSPIPPGKASDPATYQNHPWATGPYMFKSGEYVLGKPLVLVKNPFWDPNTDPGRHQYVDEFDFSFNTEPAKIDQTILSDTGSAKTTISYDSVLPDDYPRFRTTASNRLIVGNIPCTSYLGPDNRQITDIRVRQALAYAYPYQAILRLRGEIPGVTRFPASNVMPPGLPGRIEYNPLPGHVPGSTDSAKAKALLTAAGKLNYPITWAYATDDETDVAKMHVIESALKEAGFDPEPYASTSAKVDRVDSNPKGPVNVRFGFWCSDWPSGSNWMPSVFHSAPIVAFGPLGNFEAFSSKVMDARMDAIPHLLLTEQAPAWNALDKLIQTKYFPIVVTGYGGVAMMRGSKVHNFFDDPNFGMPTWKDIWIG